MTIGDTVRGPVCHIEQVTNTCYSTAFTYAINDWMYIICVQNFCSSGTNEIWTKNILELHDSVYPLSLKLCSCQIVNNKIKIKYPNLWPDIVLILVNTDTNLLRYNKKVQKFHKDSLKLGLLFLECCMQTQLSQLWKPLWIILLSLLKIHEIIKCLKQKSDS